MSINLVLEILAALCFFLAAVLTLGGDRYEKYNLVALGLFLLTLGAWIIK